ncbi:conserved protein of unknown function precursor containing a T9SS type A C-terminal secretion signal [Tenacibaculum sp. 190524A02b]|uniref:Por_Secre_tail domain-containing protein n=1 Tax=Tenacibaculum vairaonense TaxID=3137860 RepID=A0ABM9PQG3_9FLAO
MKKTLLFLMLQLAFITIAKAQTYPIEIHANNRVASLQMPVSEYNSWKVDDGFGTRAVREALFKDIYSKFNDDFDFIFLVLNEEKKPDNLPFGRLIKVSNDIEGLGMNKYNNGSRYGSSGKLKSVMQLTQINFLRNGPSLHELMHNWGNFGIETHAVQSAGTNLTSTRYIPHWGFTGGNTKGQLGGFKQSTLVDKGNGAYSVESFGQNANGGNSVPFNELELYLMGMIPASEVTNFDVFTNITSVAVNNGVFDFEASNRTTFTPALLESEMGKRVPSSTTSQKEFKLLVIALTDEPLTTAQWNLLDDHAEKFGRKGSDGTSSYNFWEATNGKGSMEIANLQNSVKVLSVEDTVLNNAITIYPNPVKDKFLVDVTDKTIEVAQISLYDAIGKEVADFSMMATQEAIEINVAKYNAGLYFLKVKSKEGGTSVKKLFIE